jgi:hypothetical protein
VGKVTQYLFWKEISPTCDEGAGKLIIEQSHDGVHIHYRNLRIRLSEKEFQMWKTAFAFARPYVEHQNLLGE